MTHLKHFLQMALCLLRELSDEGGYNRYLQRTGAVHSGATWRRYIDSRHRRKYQNVKCC